MKQILCFSYIYISLSLLIPEDEQIKIISVEKAPFKSPLISLNTFTYEKNGKDWPGLCSTGTRQSPINIIDGINTVKDDQSSLIFKYKMEREFALSSEQFVFDGRGLETRAEIGDLIFKNKDGTIETFKSNKIVLHYPSEHCITLDGQTPRYPLELQIVHSLISSTNPNTTNSHIKVKKAIVSILFNDGSKLLEGDNFLSLMGIDERQQRPDNSFRIIEKDEKLNSQQSLLGNIKPGFNFESLEALKELINYDPWIYRYYGSNTQPPCNEEVEWFIYALPRAASNLQIEFLKAQIVKIRNIDKTAEEKFNVDVLKLYGNNRALGTYDDASNGKIFSMENGVAYIDNSEYSKE